MINFSESQNFLSKWFILLLIFLVGTFGFAVYTQSSDNVVWRNPGTWIFVVTMAFILLIRLNTHIDNQGIRVRFFPFVRNKVYLWTEIKEASIKKYTLFDYGGWGYRFGRNGLALTTKGNVGLQIVLKSGRTILIGTQKPGEIHDILKRLGFAADGTNQ